MGRQGKKKNYANSSNKSHQNAASTSNSGTAAGGASDLLNFHFSSNPQQQQTTTSNRSNNNYNNNNQRRNYNNNQQNRNNNHRRNNNNNKNKNDKFYQKTQEKNRSSVRRKASTSMFYLHSSAEHAFIISRCGDGKIATNQQQQYTFSGCDESVSWEAVRIVRHLIPTKNDYNIKKKGTTNDHHTCPICLDHYVCERITKCGHIFCLPCILRHVYTYSEANPYAEVKCPCCSVPLHIQDLRCVTYNSYLPVQIKQKIKLNKLHRMKECSAPYLPLPNECKHSSIHAIPKMNDKDSQYTRFNYLDLNTFHQHLQSNIQQLQKEISTLKQQQQAFAASRAGRSNASRSSTTINSVELYFLNLSLDNVNKEVQKRIDETDQEQALIDRFGKPSSGMYQHQSKALLARNYHQLDLQKGKNHDDHCDNSIQNAPSTDYTDSHEQSPRQHYSQHEEHSTNSFTNHSNDPNTTNDDDAMFSMECIRTTPPLATSTDMTENDANKFQQFVTSSATNATVNDGNSPNGAGINSTGQRGRGVSIGSEYSAASAITDSSSTGFNVHRFRGNSISSDGFLENELHLSDEHNQRHRSSSIHSENTNDHNNKEPGKAKRKSSNKKGSHNMQQPCELPSSMYLEDGATQFYQSEDGQLCFLSRFNMNCLLSDFSATIPDDLLSDDNNNDIPTYTQKQRRKLMPLPDHIEGNVLEIENIHLTQEIRKRMPFLSHLPLHTDIVFVELDINRFLSNETKAKFKAEFDKRKKRRMGKINAEKRADRLMKKKEQERINDLKARMQRIDPNDEFFHVSLPPVEMEPLSGESFGPVVSATINDNPDGGGNNSNLTSSTTAPRSASLSSSSSPYNNPSISFKDACRSGGAFPALNATSSAEMNFPALGASSSTQQPAAKRATQPIAVAWGSSASKPKAVLPVGSAPSSSTATTLTGITSSKKKGKKEKIVLFSTGGRRGGGY